MQNQQLILYFDRFYNAVIKPIIKDYRIESEWTYFTSLFKNSVLQKDRVNLYLNILEYQNVKEKQQQGLILQPTLFFNPLKNINKQFQTYKSPKQNRYQTDNSQNLISTSSTTKAIKNYKNVLNTDKDQNLLLQKNLDHSSEIIFKHERRASEPKTSYEIKSFKNTIKFRQNSALKQQLSQSVNKLLSMFLQTQTILTNVIKS